MRGRATIPHCCASWPPIPRASSKSPPSTCASVCTGPPWICWRETFRQSRPMKPSPARSDRKSTRLNSSHLVISYAVFCLKKKKKKITKKTKNKRRGDSMYQLHPATTQPTSRDRSFHVLFFLLFVSLIFFFFFLNDGAPPDFSPFPPPAPFPFHPPARAARGGNHAPPPVRRNQEPRGDFP